MKHIPILFSTPMVQALLDGRKTQTRRLIKGQPTQQLHDVKMGYWSEQPQNLKAPYVKCPYGQPGDVLWVRETINQHGELGLEYAADREWIDEDIIPNDYGPYGGDYSHRAIPSIHMPKWAARIFLKITDVRVERLQDISEEDAKAEGIGRELWALNLPGEEHYYYENYNHEDNKGEDFLSIGEYSYNFGKETHSAAVASFCSLWQSINGGESWKANPWVWVISYEKIEKPDRFC